MTTLEKSQKKNSKKTGLNSQTSSQVASHANRSRSRANKKERVTTDISGQRCFELSKHSNRGSLLARTCEALLTSKTAWSSRLCALTWKTKDTKSNRSIFQLQPSVLPTDVSEFGSSQSEKMWSTPNTLDHLPQRSKEALIRQATTTRKGRTRPANLREQVDPETVSMWPTPTTKGFGTRIGGSDNDHETESRIWGADGERGSSDVERNNSTSTEVEGMDVADTESIGSDVGRRSEHSETWNGQREIGGENSQDDANSNEEGLQGIQAKP